MNPGTAISFNGNSLQTTSYVTSDIQHEDAPDRTATILEMAHANAIAIPYDKWPKKLVSVMGQIIGTSLTNTDANVDTFKGYLWANQANLDIAYNGSTRRYVATATKIAIKRPQNLMKANYSLEFTCQPFGMDTSATTLVDGAGAGHALTGSSNTFTPTFGGTAPWQYPVITITVTTVGGSPVSGTISVGNNATGQTVNITRTWTNGDVLVIDTSQLLNTASTTTPVTVNGTQVDYSGALPVFAPGASTVIYNDTFASRTINFNLANTNRYL